MKPITLRIPPELDYKLAKYARSERRSKSNVIRTAIEREITRCQWTYTLSSNDDSTRSVAIKTACGYHMTAVDRPTYFTFCPICGRRIA